MLGLRGGGDGVGASRPPEEILWFGCGLAFIAEGFEILCHKVVIPGDFLEAS